MSSNNNGNTALTVREWCQTNLTKYPTREEIISNCMKTLGVKRDQVVRKLRIISGSPSSRVTVGLSETDLRKKCDILFMIEDAVKRLPKDRYITDAEFREHFCQVPANKYKAKATLPQFNIYKGTAGGVTYWSRPENISRLKESGVLN